MPTDLRVVITAEHSSLKFGGEAALPLQYFRVLRARGIEAWLVTHERTRTELLTFFPRDHDRIVFVPDTALHLILFRASGLLPKSISYYTIGLMLRLLTQLIQRRLIRKLVKEKSISVIHQPFPVSPKEPSLIFGLGAPVVIGPMNGGMEFPPGFRKMQNSWEYISLGLQRRLSHIINFLLPGKRRAAMLIVANERTRRALPRGVCANVTELVENGVDLSLWKPAPTRDKLDPLLTRFVVVARLVDWKAVDILLHAFRDATRMARINLAIIGDGPERPNLEKLASALGIFEERGELAGKVTFTGWLSQVECAERLCNSDAMVLSSLYECGGAVVLEAMAMGIPVIATDWGGPADYLDPTCGILVKPRSRESFMEGLCGAMVRLAQSPQERASMGRAGRQKIVEQFDWEAKIDRILEIYQQVIRVSSPGH